MEDIEKCLVKFVYNPYDENTNYNLGYAYELNKQYAGAISYYLRCAEFTSCNILASESLLRASLCLSAQKGRDQKELYFIRHAITSSPNSIEPYYIASLYFTWRSGNTPETRNWLEAYMYASMGINILENNLQTKPFRNNTENYSKYKLYAQKAWAGSEIGKINEARQIYTRLLSTFNNNITENNIIKNLKERLPQCHHPIVPYSKNKMDKLKFDFKNYDKIDTNYSQIYQDMFVISMFNGKTNGTYLEIGAGDYINGNNTYLLEKNFNWAGVSVDINRHFVDNFNKHRENLCLHCDARNKQCFDFFTDAGLTTIDYLQLDADPADVTFDILSKLPFNKFKFGVITYEHDFYNDDTGEFRDKSRELLKNKGYKLIVGNISPMKNKYPFEDWWIHPELIDEHIYKLFERDDDTPINGEEYMLTKSEYMNNSIFEIDSKLTTIRNYHKNASATFKLFKNCNISNCIRRGYRWKEHQHAFIDKYLDKNSIVIEAGGHVGTLAVKLAQTCKFTYCFEPVKNTYDLLQFNMKKNCEMDKYKLFNKGLGECIKNSNISWISHDGPGGIGLTNNFIQAPDNLKCKNSTSLQILTIDSLNLDGLDFIKMGVEGYEEHIINGAMNTIKKYKPKIILECYKSLDPLEPASLSFVKNKYKFLIDTGYEVTKLWFADFLFLPIADKQHKSIITFGTDYLFKNQKIRFRQQAADINLFDSIIIEDENTIKPLVINHEKFIKNNKRGYGYWIWKPLIIKRQLEKMKNNDILFYLDCGSSILNNSARITTYIEKLKSNDILVFENRDHLMKRYTKTNVIEEFNINNDILDQYMIESACIILKKSEFTIKFIDNWINYMIKDNYILINDDLLNLPQDEDFIEHRHDQIILGILARQCKEVYVYNGVEELYDNGPTHGTFFSSRLTDDGPRIYSKPLPY